MARPTLRPTPRQQHTSPIQDLHSGTLLDRLAFASFPRYRAGMTLEVADAKYILRSKKILLDIHPWKPKPARNGKSTQSCFESRIGFEFSIRRGLWFRINIPAREPETATFQLECDIPNSRSHLPLYRLDYKSLHTHSNSLEWGPSWLRGIFFSVGETHEHNCIYHVIPKLKRLRSGGVHTARRITPDFANYEGALGYVCAILKIQNGDKIPERNAQPELF